VRESPAIPIIKELLSKKAVVKAHDPIAIPNAKKMLGAGKKRVTFAATLAEAVEGAQAILVITRWKEFEKLSDLVAGVTPPPLVLDGRRMMERGKFVRYDGVGLGKQRKAS
jgi:UDP-glucose 6-dehydrogenase